MTPSNKLSCPPKIFPPLSLKILLFSKKLLNDKIFETSFLIKKVIFILVARRLLSFKRDSSPRNGFLAFSQKITLFWKKLVFRLLTGNRWKRENFLIWHLILSGSRELTTSTLLNSSLKKNFCGWLQQLFLNFLKILAQRYNFITLRNRLIHFWISVRKYVVFSMYETY